MVLKDSLGSLSSLALWLFSSYEPAPYVSTQSNFLHRFQHLQKTMLETVQKITLPSAWALLHFFGSSASTSRGARIPLAARWSTPRSGRRTPAPRQHRGRRAAPPARHTALAAAHGEFNKAPLRETGPTRRNGWSHAQEKPSSKDTTGSCSGKILTKPSLFLSKGITRPGPRKLGWCGRTAEWLAWPSLSSCNPTQALVLSWVTALLQIYMEPNKPIHC